MIIAGKTPLENRAIYICIDEVRACGDFSGRLVSVHLSEPVRFHSAGELALVADRLLDAAGIAPRYEERRSFSSVGPPPQTRAKKVVTPHGVHFKEGACATFEVRVYFRRNATWQGEVRWIEQGEHEMFRSVMELLRMMNDAVTAQIETELPQLAAN